MCAIYVNDSLPEASWVELQEKFRITICLTQINPTVRSHNGIGNNNVTILKYADDTCVIGCIGDNHDLCYYIFGDKQDSLTMHWFRSAIKCF